MLGKLLTASQLPVLPTLAGGGLPKRLHPIAMDGYQRYFHGKKGFSPEDLKALREGIVQLSNDPFAMWSAITGLGLLAVLVDREGDAEAGGEIRKLIASGGQHLAPIAREVGKALGLQAAEPTEAASHERQHFLASSTPKRAAVHDAPRPAGSLPLYAVDYAMVSARFREVRLVQNAKWRAKLTDL